MWHPSFMLDLYTIQAYVTCIGSITAVVNEVDIPQPKHTPMPHRLNLGFSRPIDGSDRLIVTAIDSRSLLSLQHPVQTRSPYE
jgi:hypothetical protein